MRKSLINHSVLEQETEMDHTLPETETQKILVQIWEELLNKENIGIRNNFFELGGHSVLAIQMVSRIKTEWNVNITLKDLFDHPVIQELAEIVEQYVVNGDSIQQEMELKKFKQQEMYPISPIQYPEWFLIKLNPDSTFYNVGEAVRMKGSLNEEAFLGALNAIFKRHDAFRVSFVEMDGRPYMKLNDLRPFNKDTIIDIRTEKDPENTAKKMVQNSFNHVFHLDDFPMHLVKIIQMADEEYLFVFVTNHILWDQLSGFNMFKEIQEYYNASVNGVDVALPELEINYIDYTIWLNSMIESGQLNYQKEYWLNKFKVIP